jgi:hypothetical protein
MRRSANTNEGWPIGPFRTPFGGNLLRVFDAQCCHTRPAFRSGVNELDRLFSHDNGLQLLHEILCLVQQQPESSGGIQISRSFDDTDGYRRWRRAVGAFNSDLDNKAHLMPQGCSWTPIVSPSTSGSCPRF